MLLLALRRESRVSKGTTEHGSDGKESTCNEEDLDSISESGRFPEGGHGNPLQYVCLENAHGQRILVGYNPWGDGLHGWLLDFTVNPRNRKCRWVGNTKSQAFFT